MSIPKLEWNIQGLLWFYFGCFQGWRSHSLSGLLSGSFSSLFGKNFSPVQQGISLVATWCHSVCSSAGYLWKSLTQSYSWTPAWWWEAVVSFSRAFLSSQGGWTALVLVLFLPGMMYSAFTDRLVHPRHKHWFIKLRRSRLTHSSGWFGAPEWELAFSHCVCSPCFGVIPGVAECVLGNLLEAVNGPLQQITCNQLPAAAALVWWLTQLFFCPCYSIPGLWSFWIFR